MDEHLMHLSPVDGRYHKKCDALRQYCSEFGLIRYRYIVEVQWLLFLSDTAGITDLPIMSQAQKDFLHKAQEGFSIKDAKAIKTIEQTTNHDVKAVEYFLREQLQVQGFAEIYQSFIHFALTSEDVNNLSYGLMLKDAVSEAIVPSLEALVKDCSDKASAYSDVAMLARTHGQSASPTTMGKEWANIAHRLSYQLKGLKSLGYFGKINGAVGNFNAHQVAYPDLNWPKLAASFVESLGLAYQSHTTQIEPHDYMATLAHQLIRIHTILIDAARDVWHYVSLGYFKQKSLAHEVGSSTMPHKVNPIDFENAEGNLGIANALLSFLAQKLPISRLQRDLTDSTVLRNWGVALGHGLLSYQSLLKGLAKLELNGPVISKDLEAHPEVLAEAIQTVMRQQGIVDAYEQLKAFTRNKSIDEALLKEFILHLDLPQAHKERLLALSPKAYIGLAVSLAKI